MLLSVANSNSATLSQWRFLQRTLLLIVLLSWGLHSRAFAGAIAPCGEPFVYDQAVVNVVVLPYSYLPAPGQLGRPVGDKLAALIQADTLFSILKFNSIGVVRLYGPPEHCAPNDVLPGLLVYDSLDWRKFAGSLPANGVDGAKSNDPVNTLGRHGLVLVWGSIYEEGDNIFVQTFVSFRRRSQTDPGENIYFKLASGYLAGRLSSQELSFPPRRITAQDVQRIEEKFASTAILRKEANDNSPQVMALVGTQSAPMQSWSVLDQSGEWIHLQVRQGRYGPQTSGWLHAKIALGDMPLHDTLPELRYVEGLVGYLRYRILGGEPEIAAAARRAFESYPAAADDDPNPVPNAVAQQLLGFLSLLASKQSPQGLTQAHENFAQAFHLAPFSSEAGNLELITRAAASFVPGSQPLGSRVFAEDLLGISALDPANAELRDNLAVLYRYSEQPEVLARVPPDQRLTSAEQLDKVKGLKVPERDDVLVYQPPTDWPLKPIV